MYLQTGGLTRVCWSNGQHQTLPDPKLGVNFEFEGRRRNHSGPAALGVLFGRDTDATGLTPSPTKLMKLDYFEDTEIRRIIFCYWEEQPA